MTVEVQRRWEGRLVRPVSVADSAQLWELARSKENFSRAWKLLENGDEVPAMELRRALGPPGAHRWFANYFQQIGHVAVVWPKKLTGRTPVRIEGVVRRGAPRELFAYMHDQVTDLRGGAFELLACVIETLPADATGDEAHIAAAHMGILPLCLCPPVDGPLVGDWGDWVEHMRPVVESLVAASRSPAS